MSLKLQMGLMVLRRNASSIWQNLPDQDRTQLKHYRGFDTRDKWPDYETRDWGVELIDELAGLEELQKVLKYKAFVEEQYSEPLELILLASHHVPPPKMFELLGLDVGVLEDFGDPVYFSVIINEIRPGANQCYDPIFSKLNKHYLFSDINSARGCIEVREQAIAQGSTNFLETAYPSVGDIVWVYQYKP